MTQNKSFVLLAVTVLVLIAGATPAHAYTDPGTGALIWQMLIAASVGVMFYARTAINWVRDRLGLGKRRPPSKLSNQPEHEPSEADR